MSSLKSPLAGAAAALVLLALGGCNAVEPRPVCSAYRSAFAARYTFVSMSGTCDATVMPLSAEELNVQAYVPDPNKPGDLPKMGIEATIVGNAVAAGEAAMPPVEDPKASEYSLGAFTTPRSGDDDLCKVPMMNDTKLMLPALPNNMGDAVDVAYHFANVNVLVKPSSNGLHFGADLTRTDSGCTIIYKVSAVAPAVPCGDNPMDPTMGNPSNDLCKAEPDITTGYAGSGISPDIAVECDKNLLECIPKGNFPSLVAP